MSKIIIGIDPDSQAHGVAVYDSGKLIKLKSMTTIDIYKYIENLLASRRVYYYQIEAHIENVRARRAAWHGGGG